MRHTQRFETVDFENGIVVSKRNLTGIFTLNEDSKNLTFGNRDGIGPRYGTAPLPYHTHRQVPLDTYSGYNIRTSEDNPVGPALYRRKRYLFMLSFNARINDGIVDPTSQSIYVMCNQCSNTGPTALTLNDVHLSIVSTLDQRAISAAEKFGGFSTATGATPTGLNGEFSRQIPKDNLAGGLDAYEDIASFNTATTQTAFLTAVARLGKNVEAQIAPEQKRAVRHSFLTITGREFVIDRLLGLISPSKAPNTANPGNPGDISLALCGNPNDYFYGKELDQTTPRTYTLLELASTQQWFARYTIDYSSIAGFTRKPTKDMLWIDASYSFTNLSTTTTINASATLDAVIFSDPTLRHISNYKVVNVATGGKALVYLWRDDAQSLSQKQFVSGSAIYIDNKMEIFDGSNIAYFNPNLSTTNGITLYDEDSTVKATVWKRWPSYVTGAASTFPSPFAFGPANSGLLRANTSYEFTYSVFDKTLNYETNVGTPAKLRTGATDYVSLQVTKAEVVVGPPAGTRTPNTTNPFTEPVHAQYDWWMYNVNFREYRVYYRELGTFEWLPAFTVPCVDAHYTQETGYWEWCTTAIASLPGGQPGGYVDYSPLPEGNYIDTCTFQNRTFWLSKSQLHFSLRNNPLAFPVRNAVACPNGEFLGIIAHAYPGQAEQGSRLIIFGSKETYTARFIVGAETQQLVRVGADASATLPVDGSNFIVDAWTSITAFSGRAAMIGDGILYYWGPQGVYRDDGVDIPTKISGVLEPWIDDIYDANATENIHGIYNANTDEAIWFYQPNANGGTELATRAIVYHTGQRTWSRWEFNNLVIDNAQIVENTKWDDANDALAGTRIIVGVRDLGGAVSRPMFLDEVIFAGDMQADSQYMVKSVTHTDATTRRLTFATGPASIANKTGTAAIVGFQKYTGDTSTDPDGIYTITAAGADYIEVTRQSASADIPAGALNENEYFPVWLGTSQSIACVLKSQYWVPAGMDFWGRWLYCHTSYQVSLVYDQVGTSYDLPVRYYSLPGTDYSTQTITLTDNSRGNCQILNSIPFTKDNASGQGVAYECVFSHLAGEFKLQYIAFDVAPEDKANIRFWEG
jgi:hypothetical protein